MKTTNRFFGLLILTVAMFSFTVSAETMVDYTHSEMGRYWLKKAVNDMEVNGKKIETYVIHYDNLSKPVYVGIMDGKECKTYLVRTESFEVCYACRDGVFGINYMPEQLATLSAEAARQNIDRLNYLRQRIITRNVQSEKDQLALIASYLPDVML